MVDKLPDDEMRDRYGAYYGKHDTRDADDVTRLLGKMSELERELEQAKGRAYTRAISEESSLDNALTAFAKAADERDRLKSKVAQLESERDQYKADYEAEISGSDYLRHKLGAYDNETFSASVERLVAEIRQLRGELLGCQDVIFGMVKADNQRAQEYREHKDRLNIRVSELESTLSSILDVMYESRGVVGWHLNGDVAEWDEFGWPDEIRSVLTSTNVVTLELLRAAVDFIEQSKFEMDVASGKVAMCTIDGSPWANLADAVAKYTGRDGYAHLDEHIDG